MSPFAPAAVPRSMRSTRPASPPAVSTMAHRHFARTIRPIIMPPSCSTATASISKPCSTNMADDRHGRHLVIDHIGFAVADAERSRAFYEKALAPLGIEILMSIPADVTEAGGA